MVGDGSTAVAIVSASVLLWGVHVLVLRGVREAAALNTIATVAKMVPIVIFIAVAIAGFPADVFELNFWGDAEHSLTSVAGQVRNTMLVTVFSYGILLREDLAALANPSMAGVMEAIVGPWGRVFVSIGLLISILGNYLSWSLLAAEVLHSAGKSNTMPSFLARENPDGVPFAALWLTNVVIQAFVLVTWFAESAFTIALKMTSAMTLVPYLLVAAYGLKLAWTGETYGLDGHDDRRRDGLRGAIVIESWRHGQRCRARPRPKHGAAAGNRWVCIHVMEGMPAMQWTYPAPTARIGAALSQR